jgi:cytochrome c553
MQPETGKAMLLAARGSLAVLLVATTLGVWSPAAQAAPEAQDLRGGPGQADFDTMAQRMQACVVCHGKEGRATPDGYFPRIAGKPAGYLYQQLLNFRDGRRQNVAMSHLLAHLSDDYLQEIAGHFASLDLPYPPPQPAGAAPATLARGETLVRRGDPSRDLPACAACHGAALTGVLPGVPGLLGLPRDYLAGQLGAWKNGLRRAQAPDCMAEIARRLAPDDVYALVTWLSSTPVPPDPKPVAQGPSEWPLKCGGIAQ